MALEPFGSFDFAPTLLITFHEFERHRQNVHATYTTAHFGAAQPPHNTIAPALLINATRCHVRTRSRRYYEVCASAKAGFKPSSFVALIL